MLTGAGATDYVFLEIPGGSAGMSLLGPVWLGLVLVGISGTARPSADRPASGVLAPLGIDVAVPLSLA